MVRKSKWNQIRLSLLCLFRHPIMKLVLHSKSDDIALFMELKAPKQFCIALEMKQYLSDRTVFLETKSSGAYRPGYTVLTLEKVPAGTYYIKASTYTVRLSQFSVCHLIFLFRLVTKDRSFFVSIHHVNLNWRQ